MITVEAYDRGLNYIGLVSSRIEPSFTEHLIQFGDGVGTFKLLASAPELTRWPHLLDYDNIMVTHDTNTGYYFPWVLEKRQRTTVNTGENGGDFFTVAGRSAIAVLADALVLSEQWSLTKPVTETRTCSFASKASVWYNAGDWHAPAGVLWTADTSARRRSPKGWPDPLAQWIWDVSATATSAAGTTYFRSVLTITTAARCSIFCTADNAFDLYVDGELVMSGNTWKRFQRFDVDFGVGDHVIAIKGVNYAAAGANPAGVLLSCWTSDVTSGKLISCIRRTNTTSQWVCTTMNAAAPGWDPGDILKTFTDEGKARGVNTAFAKLLCNWLANSDSSGYSWVAADRISRAFNIGDDLLAVARKLAENGYDIRTRWDPTGDVDHRLKLQVFRHMGTDRTVAANNTSGKSIILRKALNTVDASYDGDNSGTRTALIIKTDKGWQEEISATYGAVRRETMVSLGSAESTAQATAAAVAAFELIGKAVETISAQAIAVVGHVPFKDFFVGDDVYAPDSSGVLVKTRVAALTLGEDTAGNVFYTPELSSVPFNKVVQATRWLKSMVPGTVQGRLTTASAVRLPTPTGPTLAAPYDVPFSFDGAFVAGLSPKFVPREDCTLVELYCTLITAGSTDTTAYVVKNGTRVTTLTIPAGSFVVSVDSNDFYTDSDRLQIEVGTAGTSAAGLVVQARFN